MPLDSDVANADSQLHVEFYTYDKDGPWKGVPHVRIMTPGDKTNIVDRPARDSDKLRFQRQWLHFQRENSDSQVIGTPLVQWHRERPEELTDGQLQELTILKFLSVEQLAMASDTQIMRVGMGGNGLRERARTYLSSKNAQANGAELQDLKAQVAALTAALSGQIAPTAQTEPTKKRRGAPKGGWPKKQQEATA
jgi:hypothetical protein